MEKDFWAWNDVKIRLQQKSDIPYFYEREIWWVAIGRNIGFEEYGKGEHFARPVLIVRKFNQAFFIGAPMSTTGRRGKYYHEVITDGVSRTALLSQLRALDGKRLLDKIGGASEEDFAEVQFKTALLISPNSLPSLARGRGRSRFVP